MDLQVKMKEWLQGPTAQVNPKDGYTVSECKETRARRVLEFVVPLLYPEKPTRVTVTMGNTIFRALSRERPVDCGQVVKDVVQRLFFGMGKSKATPICSYVFHMYHAHEVLLPAKKNEYRIVEALLKYNVEPEEEKDPEDPEDPEDSEDSDHESLSSKEIREIQKQEFARLKKSLCNKGGSPTAKDSVERRKTPTLLEGAERNYQVIANNLKEIWDREHIQGVLIQALYKKLGIVKPEELEAAINGMPMQKKVDELEAKNAFLLEKANKLRMDPRETREDHHKVVDKLNAALQFNQKLEEYVGNPGDVVNKARLFNENLARNLVSVEKIIPVLVDLRRRWRNCWTR